MYIKWTIKKFGGAVFAKSVPLNSEIVQNVYRMDYKNCGIVQNVYRMDYKNSGIVQNVYRMDYKNSEIVQNVYKMDFLGVRSCMPQL